MEFEGKVSAANGIIMLTELTVCLPRKGIYLYKISQIEGRFCSTGGHVNVTLRLFCCKSLPSAILLERLQVSYR